MKSKNFYYPGIFNQNAIHLIAYNPLQVIAEKTQIHKILRFKTLEFCRSKNGIFKMLKNLLLKYFVGKLVSLRNCKTCEFTQTRENQNCGILTQSLN